MPRLNLLRPHRRSHQSSTNVSPPPTSSSPAPPPSISSPDTSAKPPSSLPPLDIGSPGLGAIGQWLQSPVSTATTTTTTTTTTPASAATTMTTTPAPSSAFSRTSTPWTTTAPTPAPAPTPTPAMPSSSSSGSGSNALPTPTDRKHRQPALRLASAPPSIPPAKHSTKLARLNPMSLLLRRRSSQTQAREREKYVLPEVDFNPGIIYGTRHPDWSEHAVREGRALSPVVVGAEGRERRWVQQQQQERASWEPVNIDTSVMEEEEEVAKDPIPPHMVDSSESPLSLQNENEGELHPPPPPAEAQDIGHRRGVTLVDHPLASPHHAAQNSSRFSFDESAVPSAAPSFRKKSGGDGDDDDDGYDDGYEYEDEEDFQFDMGNGEEEDDGFERANEGFFETPILQDQVSALQAAVQAMTLGNPPLGGDPVRTINLEKEEQAMPNLGGHKLLGNIANPRGLDLTEEDLAFLHEDSGLAGYENEYDEDNSDDDDDDMYYEDGIINRILPLSPEQQQQPVISDGPHLPLQNNLSPLLTPSTNPNASINHHRLSLTTNDGSLSPPPYEPHTFPPFLNPIGGGFTSPLNHSHQLLTNSLALHSLPSAPHRFSTISDPETPDFGSSSSLYPDDIIGAQPLPSDYSTSPSDPCSAIIAAANADALTADIDGTYGREFGFYASTLSPNELGGFFGTIGAPSQDLRLPVRRPSLTPISERSEGSYRNSLVGGVGWGVGGVVGLRELVREEERGGWGGWGEGELAGYVSEGEGEYTTNSPGWGTPPTPMIPLGGGGGGFRMHMSPISPISAGSPGSPVSSLSPVPQSAATLPSPAAPPGLRHPGSRAMLPTKGSFEDGVGGGGGEGVRAAS